MAGWNKKLKFCFVETFREHEAAQHDMRGDGTLVWRLGRFGELDRDVQQTSRYSKRFQTPEGFEFRLRMFANGAGKGNSTHISVFVQMCRTETDPMLPYPFQGLCIVTLYDQNTSRGKKEHFTVKFKTNSSSCFQRPTADFNPENGVAQFVSHELLRAHTNQSVAFFFRYYQHPSEMDVTVCYFWSRFVSFSHITFPSSH